MSDIEKSHIYVEPVKGSDTTSKRSFEEGHISSVWSKHSVSHRAVKEHDKGDIALKYLHNAHEGQKVPPDVRRRIMFKTDVYLFLFMGWCYCLQMADKTVSSGSSVLGIMEDLNMEDNDKYDWVTSGFYLGYLVAVLPMVLLMQKFGIAKFSCAAYVGWAVVLTLSAASQSYAGYMVTRVLMGILESVITPAFTILTSQWFPRRQHFSRTLFWFGWDGLGTILVNAIAYGCYVHRESMSLAPWRVLIIIFGLITVLTSIVFYFHIPDTPAQAWFLTEDEREWQVQMIAEENASAGYGTPVIKTYQIKEALLDPATWLAGLYMILSDVPNGASTGFSNILLQGLGFASTEKSLLMGLPCGALCLVGCLITGICSIFLFKDHRMVYAIFFAAADVLCYCLMAWGPNQGAQLFGYLATNWTNQIGMPALMSNIASNTGGFTKMLVVDAILNIAYAVGNIVGPQAFKASEKPDYPTGKGTMAGCDAGGLVMMVALMFLNVWRNKRREKSDKKLPPGIENPEFADLTDLENPEFRYAL